MPKLSIITVNLNNKDGLAKTAESVVAQTWKDYEWIIIDGGSTDGSVEVIKEYTGKSPQLAYWCSEKDGGVYFAMNKGIARASGEYCHFLNSGDYLRGPASLEELFAVDFNEDIVYGDMILEREGGRRSARKLGGKVRPSDLIYGFLSHQNMLTKTKILNISGGYRTDLRIVSDWAFYMAAICRDKAAYRYLPMTFVVNEDGGMSRSAEFRKSQWVEREKVAGEIFSKRRRFLYFFTAASLKNKVGRILYRVKKCYAAGKRGGPKNKIGETGHLPESASCRQGAQ